MKSGTFCRVTRYLRKHLSLHPIMKKETMKRNVLSIVAALMILTISGCSGLKVIADQDPTVDFTQFKTYEYYGWAEESDKILNRFDKERIEKAFGEEFKKRGMSYVESGGDVIVTLFIVTEQKTRTTATTTGVGGTYGGYGGYYGYGPGYGWGGGMSTTTYNDYDYTVGTLVVDMFDAKAKQLIWEASGSGTIKEETKGREERINRAVQQIMAKYPVKPAK